MNKKLKTLISCIVVTVFFTSNLSSISAVYAESAKTKVDANQLIKEAQQKLIEEEINNSKHNQKIENNSQQEYDEKDKKVTVTVETYDGIINNSKSVEKKLKREIGGTVKHEFKNVIKGFSVEVDKNDVEKIKKISGVRKVTKARRYKPLMNNAIDLGQAAKVWEKHKYKGKGMVISIVDTGIDYNHKDMKIKDDSAVKLTKKDIKLGDKGKYFTEKVPYGYNFADKNTDVIDRTSSMHGMHVAGITAANGDDKEVKNDKAVKGVAPEAQLLAMKVFSNNPSKYARGALSDDIVAAIDSSVEHGADIINMSLGGDAGFVNEEEPELKAIKRATEKGVVVVVAGGNSSFAFKNPKGNKIKGYVDTGLISTPGLGKDAIQVASYENNKEIKPVLNCKYDKEELSIPFTISEISPNNVFENKEQFSLVDCGYGRKVGDDEKDKKIDDFKGKDLKGKIALIKRGEIDFITKKKNAQSLGAVGVIVYNNIDKNEEMHMMEDESIKIPCIFINKDSGEKILRNIKNNLVISFKRDTITVNNPEKGQMSNFTSWGPTPDLQFKPEISAPGGKIYSTINNNRYDVKSGTSMATPYVAGSVALIKQAIKDKKLNLKGVEISRFMKNNMINTAKILNQGKLPYSPRIQGGGLIQIDDFINNDVLITGEDGKSAITLNQIENNKEFKLILKNYSNEDKTYSLENVEVYTEEKDKAEEKVISGAKVNFSQDKVTIKANSKKSIKVKLNVPNNFDKNKFVEGFIKFKSENKNLPSLSVPFISFYGQWGELQNIDQPLWKNPKAVGSVIASNIPNSKEPIVDLGIDRVKSINGMQVINPDDIAFSPDGDGVYDYAFPRLCLLRNLNEIKVDILNKDKKVIKTSGLKQFLKKNKDLNFQKGRKLLSSLKWDGKMYDRKSGKSVKVKDGQYYMKITSNAVSKTSKPQSFEMPLKVDTQAPKVEILSSNRSYSNEKYVLKWKANDGGVGLRKDKNGIANGEPFVFIDGEMVKDLKVKSEGNSIFSTEIKLSNGNKTISLVVNDNILNSEVKQKDVLVDSNIKNINDIGLSLHEGSVITNKGMIDGKYNLTGKISSRVRRVTANGIDAEISNVKNNFNVKMPVKEGKNIVNIKAYDENNNLLKEMKFNVTAYITEPELIVTTKLPMEGSKEENVLGLINTKENKINIKGKINPEEKIIKATVNKKEVKINKEGIFETETNLKQGVNYVEVEVENFRGTINKKIIKILSDTKVEDLDFEIQYFDETNKEYKKLYPNTTFNEEYKNLKIKVVTNQEINKVMLNNQNMKKENIMEYRKNIRLGQGLNKVCIYVQNSKGKVMANYAINIYYDNEKPVIYLKTPKVIENKIYTNQHTITLEGNVADNTLGYEFYINDNQVLNVEQNGEFGIEKTRRSFVKKINVENGDKIKLSVIDRCGNEDVKIYDVIVDKVAPEIIVNGVQNKKIYKNGVNIKPIITTNKKDVKIETYIDGVSRIYKGETIYTVGKHSLVIRAKDLSGNEKIKIITFEIRG
ncbi:S8 family serine peptidase [Hathewaya limosa]|uniref:Lactocepin n=1 Tax=Hathewaya limosa TaxID=1536 RepID=A0ABU0JWK3_HATLI|nr:S8 family serine peptidase [Hathewaya limosa]MDQ0480489.1 lactocepin [Hathewaya limosa]